MVKNDSKKIVKYLLDHAISNGDLDNPIRICYESLACDLGLENANYCRVCCQYLNEFQYIRVIDDDDAGNRLVCLTAIGIDFLESTDCSNA